ncbi:MAG: pantoate--beta-alanine ligase, partial [Stellaceae bacterium]
ARVLRAIAAALAAEPSAVAREIAHGRAALTKAGLGVEYLEIRNAESLAPVVAALAAPARVLAAVRLGRTRLIDNIAIG